MQWPPPVSREELAQCYPCLIALSQREFEILWFYGLIGHPGEERQCDPELVVDVSQALPRAAPSKNSSMPCVTPNSRLWSVFRCRLLLGIEKLRAQYLFYNSARTAVLTRTCSNSMLGDLAGNAFCAAQCAAAMFCVHGLLAEAHACDQGKIFDTPRETTPVAVYAIRRRVTASDFSAARKV